MKILERVFKDELSRKIFSNGSWLVVSQLISKGLFLISTIFVARYLGTEKYGQFGILKSTIMLFAMFAGLELGMTATKFISELRNSNRQRIERIIGISNLFSISISLVLAAIVFYFSDEISQYIKAEQLSLSVKICSFALFFSSLNGIQTGILAGLENFKASSINNLIAGLISSIATVLLSYKFELIGAVIGFSSNFIILYVANFFTLNRSFYKSYKIRLFNRGNWEEKAVLWKFSLPALFAGLLVGPVGWLGNYFLVHSSNGFSEMAYFDMASQWRATVLFIPAALSQIALPMLSSASGNRDNYKLMYRKNLRVNGYTAFILVIGCVCFSPLIIRFYGESFHPGLLSLIIMFITTGLVAINNVIGQAIASKNKMWMGFLANFLWGIVFIIGVYFCVIVNEWGAAGLATAYLISYIFHTLFQFLFLRKIINTL